MSSYQYHVQWISFARFKAVCYEMISKICDLPSFEYYKRDTNYYTASKNYQLGLGSTEYNRKSQQQENVLA